MGCSSLELMGCSSLSKSSRQTPTAKLEKMNQKKETHTILRAEKSKLFKLSKGNKTSKYAIFLRININTTCKKEETSETSIYH
jgi:hypothetical protein